MTSDRIQGFFDETTVKHPNSWLIDYCNQLHMWVCYDAHGNIVSSNLGIVDLRLYLRICYKEYCKKYNLSSVRHGDVILSHATLVATGVLAGTKCWDSCSIFQAWNEEFNLN